MGPHIGHRAALGTRPAEIGLGRPGTPCPSPQLFPHSSPGGRRATWLLRDGRNIVSRGRVSGKRASGERKWRLLWGEDQSAIGMGHPLVPFPWRQHGLCHLPGHTAPPCPPQPACFLRPEPPQRRVHAPGCPQPLPQASIGFCLPQANTGFCGFLGASGPR